MTVLIQPRRTLAFRLVPSLTAAFLIILGLELAMLVLIAGPLGLPELLIPASPYGPGGPDLQRNFA